MGLGLHRIGYLCLRHPLLAALVLVVISAAAGLGMMRINVDDSLTELFRADTVEFNDYERLSTRFPSSEYDVLIVVTGERLLERDNVDALRNLVLELHFVSGMKGLVSLFSAREPPDETGYPPPLFPATLPEGRDYDRFIERVRANEVIKGRLLSEDGRLALIVIALDRQTVAQEGLKQVIGDIERTAAEQLASTGLAAKLSGAPVMQLEIRNAVQRDRLVYNGLGFLVGAVICLLFFRRPSFTLIAVGAPAMAVLWALGLLGFLDVRLNLFLNVVTPLIMVIAFSDSMHMVFAVRRRLMAGDSAVDAARSAIAKVGPACVLTSLTTAAALLSLTFADSALIRTFGAAGAMATLIAFLAVITLVPALSALLLRGSAAGTESFRRHDWAMGLLAGSSQGLARHLRARAWAYSLAGVVLVAGFGAAYSQLEPRYRLADQVPDREQALAAAMELDNKLTGASPVHVLIEWQNGRSLYVPETLDIIGRVHALVEGQAGFGNVWSLESLRRWLARAGETRPEVLKDYVELLPEHLTRRFLTEDQNAVVITGRLPDIDASGLLPIVNALDGKLEALRRQYPELRIAVTGLPAIAARNSAAMISQLNYGLMSTIVIVMVMMGLAFRSWFKGLASFIPNIFPIVTAGALLFVLGEGMQFASIIALTVAFGLAVDDTIHLLQRLKLEEAEAGATAEAVSRATGAIGPALILTTVVLVIGLSVTVFSDLPSLRLFGALCAATLSAALVGALVFLPALLFAARKSADAGVEALGADEQPAPRPEQL